MSRCSWRPSAQRAAFGLLAVLPFACGQQTDVPAPNIPTPKVNVPAPMPAAQQVPPAQRSNEQTEIELSDAKVILGEDQQIRFEVKYRVTKGTADKYYELDVFFPGTENHVGKSLWGAGTGGVIKDGFRLRQVPVKEFEMYMSEAPTPMDAYKKVSNFVKGTVTQ